MGNGGTERFNRTLGNMLRSLPTRSKQKWPQMIQTMTFVYNCTVHETTGFAPFYLMFGRVPRLPVDLLFKNVLRDVTVCDYNAYVKSLLGDLRCAMALAQKTCTAEQRHQRDQYNKRVKGQPLSLGDQVLLANKGIKGKRKLADKWLPVVHTVVALKPALHIYRIRDPEGNERVVHRNLLLQVNFLPLEEALDDDAPMSMPAPSVTDDPPESDWHETDVSGLNTAAATAEPSLAGSRLSVDSWDDSRTASWVREQSYIDGPPDSTCTPPPSVAASPANVGPASALDPSTAFPALLSRPSPVNQPQASNADGPLTSRFGRVIKPLCRLIESMVQLEPVLGVQSGPPSVLHV